MCDLVSKFEITIWICIILPVVCSCLVWHAVSLTYSLHSNCPWNLNVLIWQLWRVVH